MSVFYCMGCDQLIDSDCDGANPGLNNEIVCDNCYEMMMDEDIDSQIQKEAPRNGAIREKLQ